MKKIFKSILFLILLSFLFGYIYVNKDKIEKVKETAQVYIQTINTTEEEYTNLFKINDIKFKGNDYYYEKLSENQKSIYKSLANGVKDLNNQIILRDYSYVDNQTSLSDIEIVFKYFCLDHPEVFYLDNSYVVSNSTSIIGNTVSMQVTYSVKDIEELNQKIEKINEKINYYLSYINFKDPFDAEVILHDKLAKNVRYYTYEEITDIPNMCHTIEGAFLDNEAVCDGLSEAISVLLSNVDIKCIVVIGKLDGVSHAWNMLELNDSWYNLDITSDKSIKNNDNANNTVIHSYFNVNDAVISNNHTFDEKDILPVSSGIGEYNYFLYTNKYISINEDFKRKLGKIIAENNDEDKIEFYTENADDNDVPNKLFDTLRIYNQTSYFNENRLRYYNILNSYIILKNN